MSVIHAPKKPELDLRVVAFPLAMGGALSVLFFRLWYLQVVMAPELNERAINSRETTHVQPAPRGLMTDRFGRLVAGVRPELVVTAVPNVVNKHPEILTALAAELGVEEKRLRRKLREVAASSKIPTPIFVGAPVDVGTRIAESSEKFPGIAVETMAMRYYADNRSFTHVLGHVWTPSQRDLDRLGKLGIKPAAYVGKDGVERAYEKELMGTPGSERLALDVKNGPLRVVGRDAPTPGDRLTLTLDADLQRYVTALMEQGGYKGAVVALEPATGEVLAMVSAPTFDQSVYKGGLSQQEWAKLLLDPRKPLMNRAVQTALAPGSTFKIVTTLAAYKNKIWNPNRAIFCAGSYRLGKGKPFGCLGHHGATTFERAMEKSCNVYFCTLGYELGRERLLETSQSLDLGTQTGIELNSETGGWLPTEKWLKLNRDPARWYGGDAVNFSIGQGAVSTTPLQMAVISSLVANEGRAYKPHLVRAIVPGDGVTPGRRIQPEESIRFDASPEFWSSLKRSLFRVINAGTAKVARIEDLAWGGKTGSAEHRRGEKTHGWFVGFAPLDQPKIAVAVMIEAAGHGGDVAAPIAREVVRHYLAELSKRAKSASAAPARSESPAAR